MIDISPEHFMQNNSGTDVHGNETKKPPHEETATQRREETTKPSAERKERLTIAHRKIRKQAQHTWNVLAEVAGATKRGEENGKKQKKNKTGRRRDRRGGTRWCRTYHGI
jgi:hypothetical protein